MNPYIKKQKHPYINISLHIVCFFHGDMQFMSNYMSAAAFRQPWRNKMKKEKNRKNRRICGCRISY